MKHIVLASGLGTLVSLGLMATGCGGGGSTAAGTGGTTVGTGGTTAGTGGASAGTGGSSGVNPMTLPLCTTQIRNAPCTVGDPAMPDCMVRCGPSVDPTLRGYRPLTCMANTNSATGLGFFQGACTFDPTLNYSCYKLPTPTQACPTGTMSGGACTASACTPCGDPVDVTKGYVDSTSMPKAGFCLCRTDPVTAAQTWTCGSNKEYPCYPVAVGATIPASCN